MKINENAKEQLRER